MNNTVPPSALGRLQTNETTRIVFLLEKHGIHVNDIHYSNGLGRIYVESAYITVSESGRAFVISSHEQTRRKLHGIINSK